MRRLTVRSLLPVLLLTGGLAGPLSAPPDNRAQYERRLARLDDTDADDHVRLAAWCERRDLPEETRHHYEAALAIDPDHARAREGLGFVLHTWDGWSEWIREEDRAKLEEGLLPFGGKWLPAAEARRRRELFDGWARSRALVPDGLARLNAVREAAGLRPVAEEEGMSRAAYLHARYLVVNNTTGHRQEEGRPGYTPEGAQAARDSVIAYGSEGIAEAVDGLMSTFFHRVPLLHPGLRKVGMGFVPVEGGGGFPVTVIVCLRQLEGPAEGDPDRIRWPVPDQRDVPTTFPGEAPNPLPGGREPPAGYPISITFSRGAPPPAAEVTAVLEDAASREIPCFYATPDRPVAPSALFYKDSIALIPEVPLRPSTRYTVRFTGGGLDETWSFTTAAER